MYICILFCAKFVRNYLTENMKIDAALDKRTKIKQGKHQVRFRFYNNGKAVYHTTNLYAYLDEFDELNLFSLTNKETREQYRRNNIYLTNEIDRANRLYDDLRRKGQGNISAAKFKELFIKAKNSQSGIISFDDHFKSFIDCKTGRTKDIYLTTYNKLKSIFGKDIYFDDVDYSLLQKFELELNKKGNAINTISIDLRNIRAVFRDACIKKIVSWDLYPFNEYKIKKEETEHRAITLDKLRELFSYSGTASENWSRDVAKLIFYLIGINASDLYDLDPPIDRRISYRRDKTGRLYSIKLESEALDLIEKFKGQNHFLCFQERFSNKADFLKKINGEDIIDALGKMKILKRGLNTIGFAIGVDNLTSYVLRHTWATIAGELEIPKETIKKALGHGKKEVTDIYIKFDPKKVDDANRKVINYVLNINPNNTAAPRKVRKATLRKYNSYGGEWEKVYFDEFSGGYNVYHTKHKFSPIGGGGDAEKVVGKMLAKNNGKQVEFLPEGEKKGPDVGFDNKKWDIKYINQANVATIRKYLLDARKADNVIFYWNAIKKFHDLNNAVNREIGRLLKGQIDRLPDIYYMDETGLLKLLKKGLNN